MPTLSPCPPAPPNPRALHVAAAHTLRRPPPTALPPHHPPFSFTFHFPLPPATSTAPLTSPSHPSSSSSPTAPLTFSLTITPTSTALTASLTAHSASPFTTDGVLSLTLLPTSARPSPPSTLPFLLTHAAPTTPPILLTRAPAPSRRSPPIWRDFRAPAHAVVAPDGRVAVRADVLVHAQGYADAAAAVEAAAAGRPPAEVRWRTVVEAVLGEMSMAERCVVGVAGEVKSLVELAAEAGKMRYVEVLLAKGGSVSAGKGRASCLHWAVGWGDVGFVEKLVVVFGADAEARDGAGETPLFRVGKMGGDVKRRMVECLVVRCGARLDCVSKEGECVRDVVGEELLEDIFGRGKAPGEAHV